MGGCQRGCRGGVAQFPDLKRIESDVAVECSKTKDGKHYVK